MIGCDPLGFHLLTAEEDFSPEGTHVGSTRGERRGHGLPGNPLRRPRWRTGPHRREEAGQDPSWRWLASAWPCRFSRPALPHQGRLRLHPFAVDAYSRLASSEVHVDEKAVTAIGFGRRARAFFASYGITVERALSDNAKCYISLVFASEFVSAAIVDTKIKPYCPRTNGKVERYNRTLLNEWAYARPFRSEAARTRALDKWLHMYNRHRHHRPSAAHPSAKSITWLGK